LLTYCLWKTLLPVENSLAIPMGTKFGLMNSAGRLLLRNLLSYIPIATVRSTASMSSVFTLLRSSSTRARLRCRIVQEFSSGQTTSQTGQVRKKCWQFNPEGSTIACPHFAILFNSAHFLNNIKSEIAQLLVQIETNCPTPWRVCTNSR
jgi:hypothetical protein